MTRENAGWAVAAAVVVLAMTMGAMQTAGSVGRWQVVASQMRYRGGEGHEEATVPITFLVDTATGKVHKIYALSPGDDFDRIALQTFGTNLVLGYEIPTFADVFDANLAKLKQEAEVRKAVEKIAK